VRAIEQKANVSAHIVLDAAGEHIGTVRFSYPRDGAGKLHAVAADWSTERPRKENGEADFETWTPWQYGYANGGGYDKHSAAVSGMTIGTVTLKDDGHNWYNQLRDAGYRVIQAV
jgi:hypothetical protein